MAHRRADGTFKLDMAEVEKNLREEMKGKGRRKRLLSKMKYLQTAVYVMCGGGMLGRFAAEQPMDFYIDTRVAKLPYKRRDIEQAVGILALHVKVLGLTRDTIPKQESWHNCGRF